MSGQERHFFEIGIYRCPVEQHTNEIASAKQKHLAPLENSRLTAPDSYKSAEYWFDEQHWSPWRYNEAVGWLRLYCLGKQVRGELWFVNSKRILRGARRRFLHAGKAFELFCDASQSDEEICKEVLRKLKIAAGEAPIKGRYLDLQCFLVTAPNLRWRSLLGYESNRS